MIVDTLSSGSHPVTAARADATRLQILGAAADALAEGDVAFSIGGIAERARLTRQAVYLHFRDRGDLLVSAVDELNRRLGLDARRREIGEAGDPHSALEVLVRVLVTHSARTLPAMRAVRRLLEDDARARAAWMKRPGGRAADIRQVIASLDEVGALRRGLTAQDAAALVESLVSLDAITELVVRRRWSVARAATELLRAVRAAILDSTTDDRYQR